MKKIGRILLGWWFWVTNQNDYMARRRLKNCIPCPERDGMVCGICSCVLQAKARIPHEKCPLYKWPGDRVQMDLV